MRAERLVVRRQCSLSGTQRRNKITGGEQQAGMVVPHPPRVGMLGAEHLLADRQRALVERPRPRKVALAPEADWRGC